MKAIIATLCGILCLLFLIWMFLSFIEDAICNSKEHKEFIKGNRYYIYKPSKYNLFSVLGDIIYYLFDEK